MSHLGRQPRFPRVYTRTLGFLAVLSKGDLWLVFCKKGCEVTAQIFEKDVPVNRKNAVCAGFHGARFEEGPEDTHEWPDVVPTINKAQATQCILPDGFGSIRNVIADSVNKPGWIHLDGYNDSGARPILLAGSN